MMIPYLAHYIGLKMTFTAMAQLFFFAILLSGFLFSLVCMKRKLVGRHSYLMLTSALLLSYTLIYLHSAQSLLAAQAASLALYIGSSASATALLFFAFQYANRHKWMTFPRNVVFLLEPLIFLAIHLNLTENDFISGQVVPSPGSPLVYWDYLHRIYLLLMLFLSVIIVAPGVSYGIGILRRRAALVLSAVILPVIPLTLGFDHILSPFTLEMFIFTLSGILIGIALLQTNAIDRMPFSRNRVIENMREGWLLLDNENHIVDANPTAERLLDISAKEIYGAEAKSIFYPWPNIIRTLETGQEMDAKGSYNIKDQTLYLHIRITQIKDKYKETIGRLILIQDYTERRRAEEARQQARDEMFSLLHSISGAASRSENASEFIIAAMYQLAHSFDSQQTAVFLNDREVGDDHFLLVAHQGIQPEFVESFAFLDKRYKLIEQVLKSRESLLISDVETDSRSPEFLRVALKGSLLLVPLIAEDDFVGLIILAREEEVYSDVEITRLATAAEQISSFVRSDRRRHLASTLAERQRLIRDLHDSVTQRLYALVMTTEAAQLGLSTGKIKDPVDVIAKLGFHTRQALKEMRLFLHKLQPIDLERDGLPTVLIRRLEAVEGRSGLERKLDVDENIELDPEAELALFFIAQEALNNIIKHANASAIEVTLKKTQVNIKLEIRDNGDGFDLKNVNQFGLGIKNMRTRAKQIGAKLTISSLPGQGTYVTVLIRHSALQKSIRKT